ncbi:hypothetical protein AURDEDRAFT_181823 [Auricularia subglabra TFB-10046 SS5]|nr:hypothetical protein AURDEDRAFT_181823 [Auricularia subglabra TFB-10046 SS5]
MEPTPTQGGGASDLDPTTNAFPAEQPSVVGESSSERPPNAPGDSNSAQPGETVQSGAATSEGASNSTTSITNIVSGDGQLTASCNYFMSDDEWEALYRSGTQDAGLDRLIGFSEKAADITTCTAAAEGASLPKTTTKSDSAIAPPTFNTCPERIPNGPSADLSPVDLSPANSGSTRTPDLTPELTSTEPSPARSTSSALYTPPANVAPPQPSYDDGQSKVSGLCFPDALLEKFSASLSPEAQQLAAEIAAQVGLPGDTQLAALLRPHPSGTVVVRSGRNHGNDAVQLDKYVEKAPVASVRPAALRDAARVKYRAGSLSLTASITAQLCVDGPTNLDPLLLASPAPALRTLKRGRDEDDEVEAVHKRTKESRGAQQNQAALVQGIENMQIPSAGHVQADLYEGHATFDSDTHLIVPAGQSTPRIDTQITRPGALDDDDGWAEWDDAISDVDVAHEDSLPHTGAQHASNVSIHPQQQGAAQSSVAAPAGLGQHAQTHNTSKLSPGRAIEKYARDVDRLHDEARLAVRIILRPEEQLPNAQPLVIAEWVKDDLRDIMGTQPDPTGTKHGKCKEIEACRVCGCPVTRGDWTQFNRHREHKCPIWCALVATNRHEEWLLETGLLAAQEKQFFCSYTREDAAAAASFADNDKEAVRLRALLDILDMKETETIRKTMKPGNPFAMISSLTDAVVDGLCEEVRAEAGSSEAGMET